MRAFIFIPAVTMLSSVVTSAASPLEQRDSITQYGITWTFEKPTPAGRFVTGDSWILGPVTIKNITPAPSPDRHGSVVNPPTGSKQGYDSRIAGFNASLRVELPQELQPGESLVSTASVEKIGERIPDTVPGQYCREAEPLRQLTKHLRVSERH